MERKRRAKTKTKPTEGESRFVTPVGIEWAARNSFLPGPTWKRHQETLVSCDQDEGPAAQPRV